MVPREKRLAGFTLLATAAAIGGCAAMSPAPMTPESLRREVKARVPELSDGEIVVPFEVRSEDVATARDATRRFRGEREKAQALADALASDRWFGIQYRWARSGTAIETIESREGNCVALVSAYVGLARALGLDARYAEVSVPPVREPDGEVIVRAEHIAASVDTADGMVLVRFGNSLMDRPVGRSRVIGDVEALAHVYNNRGYELLHGARARGDPPPWNEARRYFAIATKVSPGFTFAWNNLGIALARLKKPAEAELAYRTALGRDPSLTSARLNLGLLHLENGDPRAASVELDAAARLDRTNPFVHYFLGRALAESGATAEAEKALRRSIELNADYPPARALLADVRRRADADVARKDVSSRAD